MPSKVSTLIELPDSLYEAVQERLSCPGERRGFDALIQEAVEIHLLRTEPQKLFATAIRLFLQAIAITLCVARES